MTSGEDLASRLREEAVQFLEPRIDALTKQIQELPLQLSQTLGRVEHGIQELRELDLSSAASLFFEEAGDAARRGTEDLSHLARHASDLRSLETQGEILHAMLDVAGRFVPRIALFIVKGHRIEGWSSRGYDADSASGIGSYESSADNALFSKVLASDGCVVTDVLSEAPGLVELLLAGTPGSLHFFPMKTLGRPVAILVAAPSGDLRENPAVLGLLISMNALRIENLALRILKEVEIVAAAGEKPAAPPVAALRKAKDEPAEPESVVQALSEAHEAGPAPPEVPAAAEAAAPEAPAAAQALNLWTGDEPAPPPASTWGGEESPGPPPAPLEVEPGTAGRMPEPSHPTMPTLAEQAQVGPQFEEEQRLGETERQHAEAKRFARLLVSEIKLYNEQRVAEGRSNRDIYVRLKKDIDRSREMYEKRVSPGVSRKIDYFHDELIRILGDNDASTLGSDYPGPQVES